MFGLILVTHGNLALEFRLAMEHVVGPQSQIECITIGPDDDMEQRRRDILAAIKAVDRGDGVVMVTDMFGGTPSNLAISAMPGHPLIEVIAGMNLPMLVKLAKIRAEKKWSFDDAILHAQEAGRKYIHIASRILAGK